MRNQRLPPTFWIVWLVFIFQGVGIVSGIRYVQVYAPATDDPTQTPPVNQTWIEEISKSLKQDECETLIALLMDQDTVKEMEDFVSTKDTQDHKKLLDDVKRKMGNAKTKHFNCSSSLDFWNDEVGEATKGMIERNILAESVLEAALTGINRTDLQSWLHLQMKTKKHDDVFKLLHEIESRKESSEISLEPADEDDNTMNDVSSVIVIFFSVGCTVLGVLLIAILCYSDTPRESHHVPQNDYNSISRDFPHRFPSADSQKKFEIGEKFYAPEGKPLLGNVTV